MPRPMPNVQNTGNEQNPHRPGTIASLRSAFTQIGRDLGIMLFNAFRLNRHNQADAPAAEGAAPNAAAPNAAAPNAAAPVAAPEAQPAFNAKKWMTDQCAQITTALNKKNPEGNVDRNLTLRELYKSAQTLKTSLITERDNVRNSLPPGLQADFDANIAVIQRYFDNPDNTRTISQHELRFFHSYINFLKTCVAGTDAELNKTLEKVSASLSKVLNDLTANIAEPIASSTTLENTATRLEADAATARTAANRAQATFNQLPVAEQTDAARATLQTETDAATNAEAAARTARTTANNATNQLLNLPLLPEEIRTEITVRRNQEQVDNINAEITTLQAQRRTLVENNAPDDQINALDQQITQRRTDRGVAAEQLQAAQNAAQNISQTVAGMKTATKNLISTTQTMQIRALQVGGEVNDFATHVMDHTRQQLNDVVCLASATKKSDSMWIKFAQSLNKTSKDLAAADDAATTLPTGLTDKGHPQNLVTDYKVGNLTIYEHALRMFNNGDNTTINYDINDKKLALNILGAHSAMLAVRNTNHIAYAKANTLLESSAHLLGASLTLKTRETDLVALKTVLSRHASSFELKELSQTLSTLPQDADTTVESLRTVFEQGVNLEVAKKMTSKNVSASLLLEKASTDRTYENDVTVKNGASRQGVFKESMLRAIEILKTRPDSEADSTQSRMWRASKAVSNTIFGTAGNVTLDLEEDNLKGLLGLSENSRLNANTELLDELVTASAAHNDFTSKENSVSRGSLLNHITKYEKHSTRETLKNHDLNGFKDLSKVLTITAITIRPSVEERIEAMKTRLGGNPPAGNPPAGNPPAGNPPAGNPPAGNPPAGNPPAGNPPAGNPPAGNPPAVNPPAVNTPPITGQEIQHLIKQIIVTTDAKAAEDSNFNLKKLVDSGDKLAKTNSQANRDEFRRALENVQTAWASSVTTQNPLQESNWLSEDKRSGLERALKTTPVKSIPFINKTPVLGRTTAAAFNLAKILIVGSTGGAVAVGAGVAVVAGVIGGAVVAAPAVGAYQAIKRTM